VIGACFLVCLLILGYFTVWQGASDSDQAVAFLEDAANFEKAQYYFTSENYDLTKARRYYQESIRENPQENPYQWYQLSRINFIQGEFDTALHNLDMQIQYHGDAVQSVHYMYGLVYGFRADLYDREQDFELAEKHFLKFLEYVPDSPWGRVDLSWIYFSQREFGDMVAALEPVYEKEQNNPWFLNMYGLALYNTGENEKAVEYLSRATELSTNLTPENWSAIYPGNNPVDHQTGLDEFLVALNLNLELAKTGLSKVGNNEENFN
jgi:tetratricopeptide (TPR) repeat protein